MITRSDLQPPSVQVDFPQISDHSVIYFQIPLQRPPIKIVDVSTRAWKGFDEGKFRQDLIASPLCMSSESYENMSVDDLQQIYDLMLSSLLDKHAPKRTTRRRYQLLTPWFDSD